MGTCASSRRCGHVCVVASGHLWKTTFGKSDRDVDGVWSVSGACLAASTLFSWCGGWIRILSVGHHKVYIVVNPRAALYGSLHMILIGHFVPSPRYWNRSTFDSNCLRGWVPPQTELRLSWKARHRSSFTQSVVVRSYMGPVSEWGLLPR